MNASLWVRTPGLRVLKNLNLGPDLQLFYYSDRLEKVNETMVLFVTNRGLRLWWCGQPLSCHCVHLCLWICCGRPSGFKLPYIIYLTSFIKYWWWWWLLWLPWSLNKNLTHLVEDIFRWRFAIIMLGIVSSLRRFVPPSFKLKWAKITI